jgi:hypothetical protein
VPIAFAPHAPNVLTTSREQADKLTPKERDEGWERVYTYREWLLDNVFTEGTVVILPVDDGTPNNRENSPP